MEDVVTAEQFRRLALGFAEAFESSHMKHPDFRVRGGKLFAALAYPDKTWGMVKLTPEQQEEFVGTEPEVFVPQNVLRSSPQPHARRSSAPPTAFHRHKHLRLRPHKFLLLLRSQLHHPPCLVRISQSRKQLPPTHPKIRMPHMRTLKSLRK